MRIPPGQLAGGPSSPAQALAFEERFAAGTRSTGNHCDNHQPCGLSLPCGVLFAEMSDAEDNLTSRFSGLLDTVTS